MNLHPLALSRELVEKLGGKFNAAPVVPPELVLRRLEWERRKVRYRPERERYKALGLTSNGKPYLRPRRPELKGLVGKEYMKAYHKLVARNRTKKGTK